MRLPRVGGLTALAVLLGAGCGPDATAPSSSTRSPQPGSVERRGVASMHLSADPWVLSIDSADGDYRGTYLGNGQIGQQWMQTGLGYIGATALPSFLTGNYAHEALPSLPPLLPLEVRCGGQTFGADLKRLKSYHQELRLREGTLSTRTTWDTGSGEAGLEIETAVPRSGPVSGLVALKVTNRGSAAVEVGIPTSLGATAGTPEPVFQYKGQGGEYRGVLAPVDSPGVVGAPAMPPQFSVPPGKSGRFALMVQVRPPRAPTTGRAAALPTSPSAADLARWQAQSKKAAAALWQGDIEIEGDAEAQQVVRACLFYLLQSIREDSSAGVPPTGISNNAFAGHVFWDMDSWMLPALLPQHPELARAMLEYRFRTLSGARANAKAEHLPGASYAWESAATGKETLPAENIFSHGRHVTGDVALAMKQYYTATADRDWLRSRAWPVLKETADNWVARARPDGSGSFTVNGVTTPDENAGVVDHSAWTHHVARVNLQFAVETARALGQAPGARWEPTAKGLGFLRGPGGVILSYRGFTEKSKAKQADAILLEFPGGLELSDQDLGRLYDFYAPRVIKNGPAMTDAIHALVAARLGRGEEALSRFRDSYRPFVRPPYHMFSEKRTKDNLCFLTGTAGVVESVIYGFAGLHLEPDRAHPDRPRLEPHLPPGWTALRLKNLQWRGKRWDVVVRPGAPPEWRVRG